MKLVIVREKWLRGSVSSVLRSGGHMCCLGFIDLMDANDENAILDPVREKRITELFKQIGVEVTFR